MGSPDSQKTEYEMFREELLKYLEIMAKKCWQPDPEAAIDYVDAAVERRRLIAKLIKPGEGLTRK